VKIETAISLIVAVMEALVHRQTCLKSEKRDVPEELLTAALAELEANGRDTSEVRDWLFRYGVQLPQNAQPTYRRRANNQVSAEVEALICELIGKKWSKSAIAKRLKVNRRVVIRVAREFQSAQSTKNKPLIDLGKN
jgi:hypothetical protein